MTDLMWRWCVAMLARGVERRDERGDVPGWVLITVMTAGLVTVLWAVAGDALSQMLSDALRSVSS
ncbi:MAG TPA: hypothetical protein VFR87_03020 [Nocardioidaceae bacterium]|nr:hypothetical protein [Nocardioidaceae bacterium]